MSSEQEIFDKCGRSYNPGDVIFREGDMGNEMYIIQSGRVKITKQLKDGVEKTLVICLPGKPAGAVECLGIVVEAIPHCVEILQEVPTNC